MFMSMYQKTPLMKPDDANANTQLYFHISTPIIYSNAPEYHMADKNKNRYQRINYVYVRVRFQSKRRKEGILRSFVVVHRRKFLEQDPHVSPEHACFFGDLNQT